MKRSGWTLIELLVVVVIVAVGFCMCASLMGGCFGGIMPNYSQGERTGELLKVSYKGLVWKAWEVDLKTSDFGLRGNQNNWENMVSFSCRDSDLGPQLEQYIGKKVIVKYSQYWSKPWKQDSAYTLVSIRVSPEDPK